jgi:predicted RNA-binding Zn-ribbon protein involved in translation (DUF1610 family)
VFEVERRAHLAVAVVDLDALERAVLAVQPPPVRLEGVLGVEWPLLELVGERLDDGLAAGLGEQLGSVRSPGGVRGGEPLAEPPDRLGVGVRTHDDRSYRIEGINLVTRERCWTDVPPATRTVLSSRPRRGDMKVRGTRECQSCGERWSYYETGSVECPNCGSMRSVGVEDDRRLHTASTATLDLTPARNALEAGQSLRQVAERAVEETRPFTRQHGFVDGGDLLPLDDTYLAAMELQVVADAVGRATRVTDDEEFYFLSLLRGADHGERPSVEEVPDSLRDSRGLAYANAVDVYRSDLRAYLDAEPDPLAREPLGPLGEHLKRIQALQGDVPAAESEQLVGAARDIGRYLTEDDEGALADARDRLDRLG